MKKHNAIFTISFIPYFIVLFAIPYISARTWADVCFVFLLLSIIYQLCYIIFLRRRNKVSLLRSLSRFFLYALMAGSSYIVVQYIDMYINGYSVTVWVTGEVISTYYGFDAWANNGFGNILFLPFLTITLIYVMGYFKVNIAKKK
jgi:hypothetical protein